MSGSPPHPPPPTPQPDREGLGGEEHSCVPPHPEFAQAHLKAGMSRRIERGHLWVFSNEIESFSPHPPAAGAEVVVRTAKGWRAGVGLYSPGALIAIRLYSRVVRAFDESLVRQRLGAALEFRLRLHPAFADSAQRVCFSEGDFLPGLIVDRYANHLSVQFLTVGVDRRREMILDLLDSMFQPAAIVERGDVASRGLEGLPESTGVVRGNLDPDLAVTLGGLRLRADLLGGQKTGLFLDQRENWETAGRMAAGRRVLDCFCYQGGWSLHAAQGGASQCLGLDVSEAALGVARDNARRNGLDRLCRFEHADVFERLRALDKEKARFDLIILDPPAFTKNRRETEDALRGYREINLRALRMLEPGGRLITCSCSHHLSSELFDEMLRLSARDANRLVRMLPTPGQAADHPILLSVPETHYLKTRILEVLDP